MDPALALHSSGAPFPYSMESLTVEPLPLLLLFVVVVSCI